MTGSGAAGQPRQIDPALYDRTLFDALLGAASARGGKTAVLEDSERQPLTYSRLLIGAMVLGEKIARLTGPGEHVGVFLPNTAGVAVTFFALQAQGRIPAMLNYSIGARNVLACCKAAQIRTVLTSRRFVELAGLEEQIAALESQVNIVWLEDIRARIGTLDKLKGVIAAKRARSRHARLNVDPGAPAVVLFTSGTEGVPKGVVLSHRALLANIQQILQVLSFTPADLMFNALPVFHSFGLTAGFLLPLLTNFRTFLYPSPLHYKQIPELIGDTKATILLSTDTFAQGWAKAAGKDDLQSLRLIVLGAEKVKPQTRALWRREFGLELSEGYGVTETAPVLAVNTAEHSKEGTVGRPVPDLELRIDPVPGLKKGGRLCVRGPNVMTGYLYADEPGVLKAPADGWHDTGDIAEIDEDGFISITGRAKRFAKIGGEMVSLAAVESYAQELWPEALSAAITVADQRKGEQIVLVTDNGGATRDELLGWAKRHGVSEIMVPRQFMHVADMPVLGTGKLDYPRIEEMVRADG